METKTNLIEESLDDLINFLNKDKMDKLKSIYQETLKNK